MRRLSTAALLLAIAGSAPGQRLHPKRTYPAFGIGPSGASAIIEAGRVVKIDDVLDASAAAAAGLQRGDVIESAQGRTLAVDDPRVVLGTAIGMAEAEQGRLVLGVRRANKVHKVVVELPALGAYSRTWPANCTKSSKIIEQTARFLVAAQSKDGSYLLNKKARRARGIRDNLQGCLASLFLLSTGDRNYLPNVERAVLPLAKRAETRRNAGGHVNWQLGYQGILLAEYYLRSGDRRVLAGLQELCNWAVENQAAGGWGHGERVGPGYVQSGLMNHAGLPILIALTLAQECGLEVDRAAFARAVKLMYRMAGHGCIAYGDHRAELGWSNTNGRNAMLACGVLALERRARAGTRGRTPRAARDRLVLPAGVRPYGRWLQRDVARHGFHAHPCRQTSALPSPDGCSALVLRSLQATRRWLLDAGDPARQQALLRAGMGYGRCGSDVHGSAANPAGSRERSPRSSARRSPNRTSHGAARLTLPSSAPKVRAASARKTQPRTLSTSASLAAEESKATSSFGGKHLLHYSPMVRTWAARCLGNRNDKAARDILAKAVQHEDPRVRRAVYDAISGYDNWRRPPSGRMSPTIVSRDFLADAVATLQNDGAAWWEIDGALLVLGRALPADIRKHMKLVSKFARHEDWYLRDGAFWAMIGLHESMSADEFCQLASIYASSRHVFERSSYDAGFRRLLRKDKVAYERIRMREAVLTLGKTMHKPKVVLGYGQGGIHEAAHRTMMILKHFDPSAYEHMVDDFVAYLGDLGALLPAQQLADHGQQVAARDPARARPPRQARQGDRQGAQRHPAPLPELRPEEGRQAAPGNRREDQSGDRALRRAVRHCALKGIWAERRCAVSAAAR